MLNYGDYFSSGLTYDQFLDKYATADQLSKWSSFRASITLSDPQIELLSSFVREMKVLVLAGAWCGDCVNQCPIFEHFADENEKIQIRYLDRDDNPELAKDVETCGGARVPTVIFLSEDNFVCGRYGDRTLSKYRKAAADLSGAACSSGLVMKGDALTAAVVQDWLDEFERIQLMLRTSGRLRKLHGD